MTDGDDQQQRVASDWDVYWRGTHENIAHQEGGVQDIVLAQFWEEVFQQQLATEKPCHLLDLACGNGAVTRFAHRAAQRVASSPMTTCCLDYSTSAVLELKKRYPDAQCVAADALRAPFADQSFNIVGSQFGLEYAGVEAVGEAARLVAPQGMLAAIMHLKYGAIYRECTGNLRAVEAIQQSNVLDRAREAFDAGFALEAGSGSVEAFKSADKHLAPTVKALEDVMRTMGQNAAGGLARQLYTDIAHMYRKISAYAPEDIIGWIDRMVWELDAYAGRMSSMMKAAIDEPGMQRVVSLVEACELTIISRETLLMGEDREAAAWALLSRLH
ncbi:MAG: class I SAM-dependent methyltransferase [Pseudomonadales bacterium]